MVLLQVRFSLTRANSKDRVLKCFQNEFAGYKVDMPNMLQRLVEFLDNEEDADGAGLNAAEKILANFKSRKDGISNFRGKKLNFTHLYEFLFSMEFNPPIDDKVDHDIMNAPLSHYFIHTSLKSYFTGNIFGKYSILPIIDALKQGVRVVELDLFPCGKDGICVRPNWNFERPLQLQDCLDSIKEHAFSPTRNYPVIITFKDGLKPDLQSKATKMINLTFDGMVYHHDLSLEDFPSPAQLQNKILISRRPPKEYLYATDDDRVVVRDGDKTRQVLVDQKYQSLFAFHAVEPEGMLREALTDKAKKIQQPGWYENDVISFTQTRFLRTRPQNKLFTNAPYKPQRAWMHGAQMIALSRQEDKEKLWLMQGMFRGNGGCGYVKKPSFLLNAGSSGAFYPTENPVVVKTLKIKVYMGEFKKRIGLLSKPDLYVMISIAGVPQDEKTMKTTVNNNERKKRNASKNKEQQIKKEKKDEWRPTWGEEFTFPLTYPELALLSIQVYDHKVSAADGFGGQTCLPVSKLIEGIRAVQLYNEKGEACSKTMLLMRFRSYLPV